MGLSVIGAGFGRTGTLSLKLALEELGLGPCHHMEEVMAHPEQIPVWHAAGRGEPVDWDALLRDYRSTVDWPSAQFWRELADRYPVAKVVLTVRDPERWYESFSKTILVLMQARDAAPNPTIRAILDMTVDVIAKRAFDNQLQDPAKVKAAFERHIDEVKATIPAGRLLLYQVSEGWAPLCGFLGKPIPATPFPRTNSTPEFWELIQNAGNPA